MSGIQLSYRELTGAIHPMPKKSTRGSKAAQQRARQEQWRKRIAGPAIAQTTQALKDLYEIDPTPPVATAGPPAPMAGTSTVSAPATSPSPAAGAARGRPSGTVGTQGYARPSQAPRYTRGRIQATIMSLEDEMYYVRTDIRRLIILTAVCMAILIVLSFIIR